MEGAAVDALARVHAPLQRGDTVNLNVSDVGVGLAAAKVVRVLDKVVAGVLWVVLHPVLKGWVIRAVFLIAVIE